MPPPKKQAASAAGADASLRESLAELRSTLTKGVLLTRERINETLEDAVKRGRMTRDDAEELAANLMGIGRRQAQDLLADVDRALGSGRRRTAESTDAIVRKVDKARRAAGLGPAFPILGYEDLTAAQVAERLLELSPAELRKVRDHERRNANRKSVLTAIDRVLG
jgi:polyhydroxyalkanoate synthesis regulator phasin